MKNGFATEAKVGVFVLIAVALLVYISVRINRGGFTFDKTRVAYILFDEVPGLIVRTPVEYAGIRVGTVEEITLQDRRARVRVRLNPKVVLYEDSVVKLANRGMLGEKVVAIEGGGAGAEIPDGGEIVAVSSSAGFDEAIENFNEVAQAIKDLIKGGDGKPSIKDIVDNVNTVTEDLRGLVRGNRQELDTIVRNFSQLSSTLNNGDLKEIIVNLKTTSSQIKSFLEGAQDTEGGVLGDVRNVVKKLDDTASSLNRVMAKIERGEGTLGQLISDDSTVTKVNDALDGINSFVGTVKNLEVAAGFRGEYLSSAGEIQAAASFRVRPARDKYFLIEFTNSPLEFTTSSTQVTTTTTTPPGTTITERENVRSDRLGVTLLFAKRFYDLTLKAGLIRSSGGLAAEYSMFRDYLTLGVEGFDFGREENPHVRAFAAVHLWKIFTIIGGIDDLAHRDGRRNYFGGAGVMLTDQDLKSLFSVAPLVAK